MVETMIDVALQMPKKVFISLCKILYKIVAMIPDVVIFIIFFFLMFLAILCGRWLWKNREEWKSRVF